MNLKTHVEQIVFAVGGTGGHILPAKALAKGLEKHFRVTFAGIQLTQIQACDGAINIEGENLSLRHPMRSSWKMFKGIIQSMRLLKKLHPKLVVGFGSYHSFPVMVAAKLLKIPYILYEPNRIAGRVNRLFAKGALFTAGLFDFIQTEFNAPFKVIQPLVFIKKTPQMEARKQLGLKPDQETLLVFGGSQGALAINESLMRIAPHFPTALQIFHICGYHSDPKVIEECYRDYGINSMVKQFEERMDLAWSAANLAVCRAGAGTMIEQIEYGVPALYLPYPFDRDGHQKANAEYVSTIIGGAIVSDRQEVTLTEIEKLMSQRNELAMNLERYREKMKREQLKNLILEVCV